MTGELQGKYLGNFKRAGKIVQKHKRYEKDIIKHSFSLSAIAYFLPGIFMYHVLYKGYQPSGDGEEF
ncbi:hypothetical protein GCM10009122_59620 [Fulvivirga kasyanovii]